MGFLPGTFKSIWTNFAIGLIGGSGNRNFRYGYSTLALLMHRSSLLSFIHSHFMFYSDEASWIRFIRRIVEVSK